MLLSKTFDYLPYPKNISKVWVFPLTIALNGLDPLTKVCVELDGDSCYLVSILLRRSQLLEIVPVFSNLVFLCL